MLGLALFVFLAFGSEEDDKAYTDKDVEVAIGGEELYQAYDQDRDNADRLYTDKVVKVTGIVDTIQEDAVNNKYVVLDVGDEWGWIDCYLHENHTDVADQYRQGDEITLIGLCKGMSIGIKLDECVITE